jgi:hypothetical protein
MSTRKQQRITFTKITNEPMKCKTAPRMLIVLPSPGADFPGVKDNGLDERFMQ